MRTFLISILLVASSQTAFTQGKSSTTRELESRLQAVEKENDELSATTTELSSRLLRLESRYESLNTMIEDNLQAQSNLISLLGLIVTILVFGAGLYISWKTNKLQILSDKIDRYESNIAQHRDDLEDEEAQRLLRLVQQEPTDFERAYNRLAILKMQPKRYAQLKDIFQMALILQGGEKFDPMIGGNPIYMNLLTATWSLLLQHFPKQILSERSFRSFISRHSLLHNLTPIERKRCIEAVYQVCNETSLEENITLLERTLVDIYHLDQSLFDYFKKVFGRKKLKQLTHLWNGTHFTQMMFPLPAGIEVLIRHGLLKPDFLDSTKPEGKVTL